MFKVSFFNYLVNHKNRGLLLMSMYDTIKLPEGYSLFYIKPTKDTIGNLIAVWCRRLAH